VGSQRKKPAKKEGLPSSEEREPCKGGITESQNGRGWKGPLWVI